MSDKTRRTLRAVVQVLAGLAAAAPVILPVLGVGRTTEAYAVTLAVSAAVARVMHAEPVEAILRRIGLGSPAGTPPGV
jgi:hypothetical protein